MKSFHSFCAFLFCAAIQSASATFQNDEIAVIGGTPQGIGIADTMQYDCRKVHILYSQQDRQFFPQVVMPNPDARYNQSIEPATLLVHRADWRAHNLLERLAIATEPTHLFQEEGASVRRLHKSFGLGAYKELAYSFMTLRPLGLLRMLFEPAPSLGSYLQRIQVPSLQAYIQAVLFTRSHGDLALLPMKARSAIPDLGIMQPFMNEYYQDLFELGTPTYSVPTKGYNHFLDTYLASIQESGVEGRDLSTPEKTPYRLQRITVQAGNRSKPMWQVSKSGSPTPITVDRVIIATPDLHDITVTLPNTHSAEAQRVMQVLTNIQNNTQRAKVPMDILVGPTPHSDHTLTFHRRANQAGDLHGFFGTATKQIAHTPYTVQAPTLFPDPNSNVISGMDDAASSKSQKQFTWERPYIDPREEASLYGELASIQGTMGLYYLPQIFSSSLLEGALEDADKLYNDYFRDPDEKTMSMIR